MNGLVIVNYNDYKNTKKFLDNIKTYKIIDQIVIVDNCSTDNSYNLLKKTTDNKVHLIKNKTNLGYGSGINLGSKYLIDNYNIENIIVSNTDIIVNNENDIKKLLKYLSEKDVALVGPVIYEHGNYNRGWKIPTVYQDAILNIPIIHNKIRPKLLYYNNEYYNGDSSVVEVLSGCFFIIKAQILKKINYFDENMFLYYEENVLATKLKKLNLKTLVVNNIKVIHNHSVTIDKSLNKIKKYKELKKSQKYFHKSYSKASFFGLICLDITKNMALTLYYLVMFFKGGIKK